MPPAACPSFSFPVGTPLLQPFGNALWKSRDVTAHLGAQRSSVDEPSRAAADRANADGTAEGRGQAAEVHKAWFGKAIDQVALEEEQLGQIMLSIRSYGSHWLHPAVWQKEHFNGDDESAGSEAAARSAHNEEGNDPTDMDEGADTGPNDLNEANEEVIEVSDGEPPEEVNPYAMEDDEL